MAKVEEHETDDDGNHHAEPDDQRGFHVTQEQDRYQADKEES